MAEQLELQVEARETRGKNAARRLRVAGNVPATLYGLDRDPVALTVNTKEITRILSHQELRNRVLALKGGASDTAMASTYQLDPITGALLHVDIKRVDPARKIQVKVPFKAVGLPYGVKNEGGLEDVILRELTVECLPGDTPEKLEIDVTPMRAGDAIRIRDIDVGEGVRLLGNPTAVVVRVIGKRALDAAADAQEGGGEAASEEAAAEE